MKKIISVLILLAAFLPFDSIAQDTNLNLERGGFVSTKITVASSMSWARARTRTGKRWRGAFLRI